MQPDGIAWEPAETPLAGEGFETLFREQYPRLVGVLARLTGDRGQAEEIASDVFCKLARKPVLFGKRDDLMAWLYRVATNAGFDVWRSNSRRRKREEAAGVEDRRTAVEGSALEHLLREERCARVRDVLGTLKPRDAELLLLRSSGMAYRELAQAVGVQAASVGTLLARAEAEFERKYRARYGDRV
ncbi:MAG TPA: sigma-70 family RNA polymerase sigma factor [Bryobacteraceae bacterium]